MKFYMVIENVMKLKLWIHKNVVCQLQWHENWANFNVWWRQKSQVLTLFYLLNKFFEVIFFSCLQEKIRHFTTTYKILMEIHKTFTTY